MYLVLFWVGLLHVANSRWWTLPLATTVPWTTSLCVTIIFSFRSSRYFIVLDMRKNFNRQIDRQTRDGWMNEWMNRIQTKPVSGKRIWPILHQPARRRYWFDRKVNIHSEKRFIYRVYTTTFLWKIPPIAGVKLRLVYRKLAPQLLIRKYSCRHRLHSRIQHRCCTLSWGLVSAWNYRLWEARAVCPAAVLASPLGPWIRCCFP